jgi:hypothetical protein
MGVALPIIAIGSSLLGAGMSAEGQMQSANYNAQVARNNQITANQNASIALQEGQTAEEKQRLQSGAQLSKISADLAAEGVNPNEGSALNVEASKAEMGELDAQTIRYNANLTARNLKYQAAQYGSAAQLDQSQGLYGAMSSILGGASSVSSKWLTYQQIGVPGFGAPGSSPGIGAGLSGSGLTYNLP